ncbi:hypothetical protein DPEC_G00137410 [Dallia pectoralis]|uniref:Uncharacterized protein n=1 Tax=Dallia pectoralis TaxID=75939 RepID=A0ACC2GLN8_DALPE|nr:hypothetical protein DPEC_G00137410 [Dallia pectoralis]
MSSTDWNKETEKLASAKCRAKGARCHHTARPTQIYSDFAVHCPGPTGSASDPLSADQQQEQNGVNLGTKHQGMSGGRTGASASLGHAEISHRECPPSL